MEEKMPYPVPTLVKHPGQGSGIRRTMALLTSGTPEHRSAVKILLYGQSITRQTWANSVTDYLRTEFPYADLIIENKAVSGYAADKLKHTAEHDIYSFYPDLVIFHVYGGEDHYEEIVRGIRSRTTAEVILQNDHVSIASEDGNAWHDRHSFEWLPQTARKYGCEFVDIRASWQKYLEDNNLAPEALLRDHVHLNEQGCFVMSELIKQCFEQDGDKVIDKAGSEVGENIRTYTVGKDICWDNGRLRLDFEGSRLDLLAEEGKGLSARVLIDGMKPSEHNGCYIFTRPGDIPGKDWPWGVGTIAWIKHLAPLVEEEWTIRLTDIDAEAQRFRFTVEGSVTGPDGSGTNSERFVSNSGRVVLEPAAWHFIWHDHKCFLDRIPEGYEIKWQAKALCTDIYEAPQAIDPTRDHQILLAQGLDNGRHTLELIAENNESVPVKAIRSYCPSVK